MKNSRIVVLAAVILAAAVYASPAQKARGKATSARSVIFGVLHDGPRLEPIAILDEGKLIKPAADGDALPAFKKAYYQARTSYDLIFGGAKAGKVTVTKFPQGSECSPNLADVSVTSAKSRIKGKVMALATNAAITKYGSGLRRPLTASERTAIEDLAREEFEFLKVDAKILKSHSLTALDINGDKLPEFVGSFFVADTPKSRALLFIVVSKKPGSKFELEFSNVGITQEHQVMSRDIKDLDKGFLNELLLDVLDVDGDGTAEIFTYIPAFEGSNFRVHSRKDGRWEVMYEFYNYHCAF